MVIKIVDRLRIKSENLNLPIKRIRLIKNRMDIFEKLVNSFLITLLFFLIAHALKVIGKPTMEIAES